MSGGEVFPMSEGGTCGQQLHRGAGLHHMREIGPFVQGLPNQLRKQAEAVDVVGEWRR